MPPPVGWFAWWISKTISAFNLHSTSTIVNPMNEIFPKASFYTARYQVCRVGPLSHLSGIKGPALWMEGLQWGGMKMGRLTRPWDQDDLPSILTRIAPVADVYAAHVASTKKALAHSAEAIQDGRLP
ncbi:hypothetical protein BO94DRAFT_544496 [Aspergillus sclerotioniger CBS 115572]|uniref:Uncharacterized protein n=1 Tax=Aspergillus sclerotioniger CBS 115572 TaxID=1450535 RepID=A0A317X2Q4_9EURO|nr:hypothetical protein BO94DRAFT_544496 [Aspergillus sclerotioniger CBS 115572]PWY91777.1 hypothetical protein BO94DRAFT_544496 [Aspergillus sclerotioniger CBS 115572]